MDKLIKPFEGVGNIRFLSSEESVVAVLRESGINYEKEVWDNQDLTVKVPWVIIRAENNLHFFFAKDRLFEVYIDGNNGYSLPNGIHVGMPMSDAKAIDSTLKYDDWEEDWASDEGYWLENSYDDDTVYSIVVLIKEALDDDLFEKYEW